MKRKLKSTVYYSSDFKEKVISEVLNGQISAEGARKKYNIGGKMTVYRWLTAYNNSKNSKEKKALSLSAMNKEIKKTEQQTTPEAIAELKQQLEEALLKAEAYKTMIEIGKEEFGIDLEKKYGAKQSKN